MKIYSVLLVAWLALPARAEEPTAEVKAASGVENRQPTGESSSFKKGDRVFVWSQIRNADGQTVDHVWKRDGQEVWRAHFDVGSSRWRVHSRMPNAAAGSYDVQTVAGERVLGAVHFSVE
jgi:hypothetical protein